MINPRIKLTVEKHVAHVELSRVDKMNALDQAMFTSLIDTAKLISADSSIRVVVISGQGNNFCSGLDKSNFDSVMQGQGLQVSGNAESSDLSARTNGIYNQVQAVVMQWRELTVPVIVAIEGVALGGGLQIALAADMRYASSTSRFSILEIKWGLVPDMGSTQLMRHLVSEDIVRELTYTGRVFSADEAKDYGFITAINDQPVEHAIKMANQISQQNPEAIRGCKKLLNAAPYLNIEQAMLMESAEQDKIIGSRNQIEAVTAVLEKRAAEFLD